MQKGNFSLIQIAEISSILLNDPFYNDTFFVSLLTSPTTGIIIGEPDSYIAFAGKRVIEEVMKIEVLDGVQEVEY
jgi:acetyl-CoA carboxylase carboxyl transferase subunit beta